MELSSFHIEGPVLLKPRIFEDERGYFFESFNEELFRTKGLETSFLQDNESLSKKGTLRGLHFQNPPFAQGKLIRVAKGSVYDVAVDVRPQSPTYGKYLAVEISSSNKLMLWVPPGFAHGFLTLEDETIFLYKCTQLYSRESESGIIWNDSELAIDWPEMEKLVSDKDKQLASFKECVNKF